MKFIGSQTEQLMSFVHHTYMITELVIPQGRTDVAGTSGIHHQNPTTSQATGHTTTNELHCPLPTAHNEDSQGCKSQVGAGHTDNYQGKSTEFHQTGGGGVSRGGHLSYSNDSFIVS